MKMVRTFIDKVRMYSIFQKYENHGMKKENG